jgi:hypothetical protein
MLGRCADEANGSLGAHRGKKDFLAPIHVDDLFWWDAARTEPSLIASSNFVSIGNCINWKISLTNRCDKLDPGSF